MRRDQIVITVNPSTNGTARPPAGPVLNCESEKVERDPAGSGGDPVRSVDARLALPLVVPAMDGPARPLFLCRRLGLVPPRGILHTSRAVVAAAAVLPQ